MRNWIFFLVSISICSGQSIPTDSLYLGQASPGNTPKSFLLPVSSGTVAAERIAVSADGREIYYTELNNYPPTNLRVKFFKYSDNHWNGPFNLFEGYMAPGFSLTDDTLFIEKLHAGRGTPYTYFSVRTDTGWSNPVKFMLNSTLYMHYVQITNTGNVYLVANPGTSIGGLDWCTLIPGTADTMIQTLGLPLNTSANNSDFYIARDESFMILIYGPTDKSCNGYLDFFVAYKKSDNTWTNPKNLGVTINVRNAMDGRWGPYVTADKKFLFYSRGTSPPDAGICWVGLGNLLDSLRKTNFIPYLKTPISTQYDTVGRPFSFRIADSTFVDDDGNSTLTYTATASNGSALPAWMQFDSTTGVFSGTPTASGTFGVKVTATDTAQASVSCTFNFIAASPNGVQETGSIPERTQLSQNFPNPFNPTTVIGYQLAVNGNANLSIYNLLGQKVITLFDSYQSAGEHSVAWHAMDERNRPLPTGVYIYRLRTANSTIQKQMLLLK